MSICTSLGILLMQGIVWCLPNNKKQNNNLFANFNSLILVNNMRSYYKHVFFSCCVDTVAAMHVQANAIVHYGHTCFSKCDIPVYYVLPQSDLDVVSTVKAFKDNFPTDENVKLCLFYAEEFEHYRGTLQNFIN